MEFKQQKLLRNLELLHMFFSGGLISTLICLWLGLENIIKLQIALLIGEVIVFLGPKLYLKLKKRSTAPDE